MKEKTKNIRKKENISLSRKENKERKTETNKHTKLTNKQKKMTGNDLLKMTGIPFVSDGWLVVSWILIGQILGLWDVLIGCAGGGPQVPKVEGYTRHPLHQHQPPGLHHHLDRCHVIW